MIADHTVPEWYEFVGRTKTKTKTKTIMLHMSDVASEKKTKKTE